MNSRSTQFAFAFLLACSAALVPGVLRATETLVGTLPVDVSVDNKGAANATIPLAIPPGRAGLQPKIALTYNSQAGNGVAGVGLSLSTGFPRAISRGRSILARDGVVRGINFDANDKYYLDGKRLICVSGIEGQPGSTYRTEVDSFVTVTASGSGDNIETFAVADKTGITMYFGKYNGTTDGYHMLAGETTGKALDWAIKRVEDAVGNTVEFRYNEADPEGTGQNFTPGAGEQVLTSLRYTGNPSRGIGPAVLVAFRHNASQNASGIPAGQARPDAGKHYTAGRSSEFSARLDAVLVRSLSGASGEVDRTYALKYKTSDGTGLLRLEEVTQLAGSTTTKVSLQWGADAAAPSAPVVFDHSDVAAYQELVGDFNGDGKQDLLLINQNTGQLSIAYSNQMGTLAAVETGFGSTPLQSINLGGGGYGIRKVATGDFNGDGKTDLIWNRTWLGWCIALSTGSGFASPQLIIPSRPFSEYYWNWSCWEVVVGDFNGDGLDDLVTQGSFATGGQTLYGHFSLHTTRVINGSLSFTETPISNPIGERDNAYVPYSLRKFDFNGDGKADLIVTNNQRFCGGEAQFTTGGDCFAFINNGNGSFSSLPMDIFSSIDSCTGHHMMMGDVNGDGLDDIVYLEYEYSSPNVGELQPGQWQVFLSKGNGQFDRTSYAGFPTKMQIEGTQVDTYNRTYGAEEWTYRYPNGDDEQAPYPVLVGISGYEPWGMHLFDYNGDGKKDFLWYSPVKGWLCILAGSGGFDFAHPISLFGGQLTPNLPGTSFTIDLDGNGREDFVFIGGLAPLYGSPKMGENWPISTIYTTLMPGIDAYRLTGLTNGLGSTTNIAYKPTTDDTVYTPGVPVAYPIREIRSPHQVVSDIYRDSGSATPAHFSYQYSGNRLDLSGRGSLGFHSFVTLDWQTNLFKYQFFTQSFPMTGLTAREQTYRYWESGGDVNFRLISTHDNTVVFDEVKNGGTAWGTVYAFISKAIESRYEDSTTAHFRWNKANQPATLVAAELRSSPELLFAEARPAGAHITITAVSLFDEQTAVQTTIPGDYRPSDRTTDWSQAGTNTVAGSTDYAAFENLNFGRYITYGNLKQISTDFGDGFKETVTTEYKAPVGPLTGLVDNVQTSTQLGVQDPETAPIKRYTYWGSTPLVATETIDALGDKLDRTTTYHRDSAKPWRITSTDISGYNSPGDRQHIGFYTLSQNTAFDDRFDLPTTTLNAYGNATTIVYHPHFAKPISVTDVNGARVTTTYDALGRVLSVTDALDRTTTNTYSWDSSQIVTPLPNTTGLRRTSVFAVSTTATVKPTVTAYCDRLGRTIRTIKEGYNGQQAVSDTIFDALGQVVATSLPYLSGGTCLWTKTTYDPLGRVVTATAPNGTVSTNAYAGRTTTVTVAPAGGTAQANATLVDAKGRTVNVWNSDPKTGLVDTSATPSITYAYDGFGRMRTTTLKGQAKPITATYDALGRQLTLDDPDKGLWSYLNNALGQVVYQKDANSNETNAWFDPLGRPLSRITTGNGSVETAKFYYYDTTTNAARHTVQKGEKGWIGAPERAESFATGSYATVNLHYYDHKGRPSLELAQADGKWFYTFTDYDDYSRVNQVRHYWKPAGAETPDAQPYRWEDFGYTYAYDGTGSTSKSYLVSLTDSLGRSWWDTPVYDYLDRVTSVKKGGALTTSRVYRPEDGVLTGITTGSIQNLSFGYDSLGNLTSRSDATVSVGETFTYDHLNRLETRNGATVAVYQPNGNITSKTEVGNATVTINGYDAAHPHAVSSYTFNGQSTDITYDANGNLLTRIGGGTTWSMKWAGFDKPRWMAKTTGATTAGSEFHYNAARSRVMQLEFDSMTGTAPNQTPEHYNRKRLYALGSTLELNYNNAITSGTGQNWTLDTVRIYVPGPDGIIGAREFRPAAGGTEKALVYHYDHLGSVTAITDFGTTTVSMAPGNKTGRYSEDAWGQRRNPLTWNGAPTSATDDGGADSLTPRGYTGHEILDDLGLVHMNGRIYDPLLGRFLSADILVENASDLQAFNRYSYVRNRPLTLTDPSGFLSSDENKYKFQQTLTFVRNERLYTATLGSNDAKALSNYVAELTALLAKDPGTVDFDFSKVTSSGTGEQGEIPKGPPAEQGKEGTPGVTQDKADAQKTPGSNNSKISKRDPRLNRTIIIATSDIRKDEDTVRSNYKDDEDAAIEEGVDSRTRTSNSLDGVANLAGDEKESGQGFLIIDLHGFTSKYDGKDKGAIGTEVYTDEKIMTEVKAKGWDENNVIIGHCLGIDGSTKMTPFDFINEYRKRIGSKKEWVPNNPLNKQDGYKLLNKK